MEQAGPKRRCEDDVIESFRSWVRDNQLEEDREKTLFLTILTICAYELFMHGENTQVDLRIADAREIAAEGWREDVH